MYEDKALEGEAEPQGSCKVVFAKIQIYTWNFILQQLKRSEWAIDCQIWPSRMKSSYFDAEINWTLTLSYKVGAAISFWQVKYNLLWVVLAL